MLYYNSVYRKLTILKRWAFSSIPDSTKVLHRFPDATDSVVLVECLPGTVLGAGKTLGNGNKPLPSKNFHLSRGERR